MSVFFSFHSSSYILGASAAITFLLLCTVCTIKSESPTMKKAEGKFQKDGHPRVSDFTVSEKEGKKETKPKKKKEPIQSQDRV